MCSWALEYVFKIHNICVFGSQVVKGIEMDATTQIDYLKVKVLGQEFTEALGFIVTIFFFNFIIVIIGSTYFVLNGADYPFILVVGIFVGDAIAAIAFSFIFSLATRSRLSKELT